MIAPYVPEFSRPIKVKPLPGETLSLAATEDERAALAARFALPVIASVTATAQLSEDGNAVRVDGKFLAEITQTCAISGEEFGTSIAEPLALRFVEEADLDRNPSVDHGDIEIELSADELDEIGYAGDTFDLGEAIAQSLGLAIDPYAEGPNAENWRKRAGISSDDAPTGPLAEALAALKKN